jgi:hypothetical protein
MVFLEMEILRTLMAVEVVAQVVLAQSVATLDEAMAE